MTRSARALLYVSPRVADGRLEGSVSNVLHSLWLTVDQLAEALARRAGVPGVRRIAGLIGLRGARTRSGWEVEFRVFCERYGLPVPVIGAPIGGYVVDGLFVAEGVRVTEERLEERPEREAERLHVILAGWPASQ